MELREGNIITADAEDLFSSTVFEGGFGISGISVLRMSCAEEGDSVLVSVHVGDQDVDLRVVKRTDGSVSIELGEIVTLGAPDFPPSI